MSTEAGAQNQPSSATPASESTPSEPTGIESLAMKMGWNPDKEALGEQWVDAETYILRTRDIQTSQARTIRDQNRKLDSIKASVDTLKSHYQKVAESQQREFDAKIASLKQERRNAIADNDPEKVDELDAQIDDLKEAKSKVARQVESNHYDRNTPLHEWMDDNEWYGNDKELTAFANKRGRLYRVSSIEDDAEYREVLDEIAREVEEKFPEKFGKKSKASSRPAPPAGSVEPTRPTQSTRHRTFTRNDLDEEHKKVYDSWVNDLGLNGKEIIDQWIQIGELK